MTDLIARLEAAPNGNRKLDAEIAGLIGAPHGPHEDVDVESRRITSYQEIALPYTTSLDAVTALMENLPRKPHWSISYPVAEAELIFSGGPVVNAVAATPALALCIAYMKARLADYTEAG